MKPHLENHLLSPLLLIVGFCLTAAGCSVSHACTEVGCTSGFTLAFQKASTPWEPGTYSVNIDADGKQITCTATLPLSATDAEPSSCSDKSVQLGVSGSALPAAEHSLSELSFTSMPARVKVTVTRDGMIVGDKEFTPTYEKSQPNGPDCEPTCNSASGSLPLP